MSRSLGLASALIVVASCTFVSPPPAEPVHGMPEAGTESDCARACTHLRALKCPEGDPTLGEDRIPNTGDESTCEDTCRDVESSGYTTLNPRCVSTVASCADLFSCGWSAE